MASDPLSMVGNAATITNNNYTDVQHSGRETASPAHMKGADTSSQAAANELNLTRPVVDPTDVADAGKQPEKAAEALGQAVTRANEMMQQAHSRLKFELNKDYDGRLVVQVVDTESDEVIRQIPDKQTLEFAKYIDGLSGMLFIEEA